MQPHLIRFTFLEQLCNPPTQSQSTAVHREWCYPGLSSLWSGTNPGRIRQALGKKLPLPTEPIEAASFSTGWCAFRHETCLPSRRTHTVHPNCTSLDFLAKYSNFTHWTRSFGILLSGTGLRQQNILSPLSSS